MESIKKLKEFFADEINFFNQQAISSKHQKNSIYQQIIFHIIHDKSKKIRLLVPLLIGKILGYESDQLKFAACAIEIIHNATLLHDDIVDDSNLRHGLKTAHTIWGNKLAVLIGDYLFGQALVLISKTDSCKIMEIIASATQDIIDGEVNNILTKNSTEIKAEQYMEYITQKTAQLFATSTSIPSILMEKPEDEIKNWQDFGLNFGIAFQLIDDIMDFCNIDHFGKEKGRDLQNSQITLPMIMCFADADTEELKFWQRTLEEKIVYENDLQLCMNFLQKHNALDRCKKMAQDYLQKAIDFLQNIENMKNENFIKMAKDLCTELFSRIKQIN